MNAPMGNAWQSFSDALPLQPGSFPVSTSPGSDSAEDASKTQFYCYDNEIPDFVEGKIEQQYGTIFSSLKKLRLSGEVDNASTYIAIKEGKITAILLFKQIKNRVHVVNQVLSLSEEDIQSFTSYIFRTFKGVASISFTAIHTDLQQLGFPFQRVNQSENIVVSLPSSIKEYSSSLGKSTRHNLNYYRNKLNREFPPFTFTVYENEAITASQIRAVMDLSKVRIEGKGKAFGFTEQEQEHLIQLAESAGLVGVLTIDGKICAGSICYRAGDNFSLEVIAHDPAFNEYRLGTLCCYLTISECIARNAKEFHFLWGEYDYKYRFLGQQRKLDNLVIYRSAWQMMLAPRLALDMMLRNAIRNAKLWKNNPERKKSFIEVKVIQALTWLTKHREKLSTH